ASGVCVDNGAASFTITNIGAGTAQDEPYSVTDANGTTVTTGSFTLAPGESTTVSVSGVVGPATLNSPGLAAVTAATNCGQSVTSPAQLAAFGVCVSSGSVVFTVANQGSSMTQPLVYEASAPDAGYQSTGSLLLGAGETQTVAVDGVTGIVTLSGPGLNAVNVDSDCA